MESIMDDKVEELKNEFKSILENMKEETNVNDKLTVFFDKVRELDDNSKRDLFDASFGEVDKQSHEFYDRKQLKMKKVETCSTEGNIMNLVAEYSPENLLGLAKTVEDSQKPATVSGLMEAMIFNKFYDTDVAEIYFDRLKTLQPVTEWSVPISFFCSEIKERDNIPNLDEGFGKYLKNIEAKNLLHFIEHSENAIPSKDVNKYIRGKETTQKIMNYIKSGEIFQDEKKRILEMAVNPNTQLGKFFTADERGKLKNILISLELRSDRVYVLERLTSIFDPALYQLEALILQSKRDRFEYIYKKKMQVGLENDGEGIREVTRNFDESIDQKAKELKDTIDEYKGIYNQLIKFRSEAVKKGDLREFVYNSKDLLKESLQNQKIKRPIYERLMQAIDHLARTLGMKFLDSKTLFSYQTNKIGSLVDSCKFYSSDDDIKKNKK